MDKIFIELGFEVFIATVFGIIAKILKQPLIIAYIITGFILGPSLFGYISNSEIISLFSTIGIAFLLFIVGMELSTEKLKEAGKKVLAIGLVQIILTTILGYGVSILLGFNSVSSFYIGMLLAFSSTVIVINLLSEKKSLGTLYGRSVIGILVLQDIVALFVLVVLSGMKGGDALTLISFLTIFLKGFLAVLAVYLFSQYILSHVFRFLAHSLDILFLASIAWCFAIAGLAVLLGFSVEMGAFLAGMSLANLPYSEEITSKLSSLRDFFLILFFIALGMQVNWSGVSGMIIPLVVLVLFVIVIKTLITMVTMGSFGYTKRTSFYSAISLSQVSEFSLIIAGIALSLGHITSSTATIIVLVTIITILTSSYLITFTGYIYNVLQKRLGIFERSVSDIEEKDLLALKDHIILFGYHRIGTRLLKSLKKISKKIIVVDLNPEIVEDLNCKGTRCIYGDAYDMGLLAKLNIEKAKMIVTTFPAKKSNLYLIKKVKAKNKRAKIITTAEQATEALELYKSGADYVILPHYISGEHVASILGQKNGDGLRKARKYHIGFLKDVVKEK